MLKTFLPFPQHFFFIVSNTHRKTNKPLKLATVKLFKYTETQSEAYSVYFRQI